MILFYCPNLEAVITSKIIVVITSKIIVRFGFVTRGKGRPPLG